MDVTNTSWVQARAALTVGYSGGHRSIAAPTLNPATRALQTSSKTTDQLIAGQVSEKPRFDVNHSNSQLAKHTLQLYTRPADRNEAATGVALGRVVDFRA